MGLIREIPPTAGWPIYAKDLFSRRPGGRDVSLEDDFKNYLGVETAQVVNSGTAAFYLILQTLKDLSPCRTVIIPSYICPLVPLAVKRAGLNVEVCDITGRDFNFNIPELEKLCSQNDDILAIVLAHLGGIPSDFDAVSAVAKEHGIFVIEDCAQSLGAVYKNKPVGTLGDFAFFSLCRGKGLTLFEGGVAVTARQKYVEPLRKKVNQLARENFLAEVSKVLELFGYGIFYRPQLFWLVFKLPQWFWLMQGDRIRAFEDYYEMDFPVHKVSALRQSFAHASFYRLEAEIEKQRRKATYYIQKLAGLPGLTVIQEEAGTEATYPFVTLIFDEVEKREKVFKVFNQSGLGISQIYSLAVTEFKYLKDMIPPGDSPGGSYLAKREMTLSTSSFLRDQDLVSIVQKIKNLLHY